MGNSLTSSLLQLVWTSGFVSTEAVNGALIIPHYVKDWSIHDLRFEAALFQPPLDMPHILPSLNYHLADMLQGLWLEEPCWSTCPLKGKRVGGERTVTPLISMKMTMLMTMTMTMKMTMTRTVTMTMMVMMAIRWQWRWRSDDHINNNNDNSGDDSS